ncbi:MAG: cupin domain-containing protein [Novosphingobium sp.]
MSVFPSETRARFGAHYPETAHRLSHRLDVHPLLELEALADLAERLPPQSVAYNPGDLPIGASAHPPPPPFPASEAIRNVAQSGCWTVLQKVEQDPRYAALMAELLDELRPEIEATTGPMTLIQGFIFVTSPGGVVPYHFDAEHNVLMQVRGTKAMTVFPAGDPAFARDEAHERFHARGEYLLSWRDELEAGGKRFELGPGDALYVPVKSPHFVVTGPEPSVSLSITWRSTWSHEEADARSFNAVLRRNGIEPGATHRWPRRNRAKALGWRMVRRLVGTG